jgi:glycosyltransferase involved in cell wall biosynthesis
MNNARYLVITPVRNEEARIRATIDSMLAQTVRPVGWIIVDDGSSDQTPQIVEDVAAQHRWIHLLRRVDRGFRKPGTGVMEAFCDGYREIPDAGWDFLVKLDGDLSFAGDYFEKCFERFANNLKLGIGGGTICCVVDGVAVTESKGDPPFHVRGATKIYRRACWESIGGLIKTTGWDTMDEVKANMLGWQTYSFRGLNVITLRATGGADGVWRNFFKNGRANYIVGYHPLFMAAKCLRRIRQRPYGVVAAALWCGFVSGYLGRASRLADRDVMRYLRGQQFRALLGKDCLWTMSLPEVEVSAAR